MSEGDGKSLGMPLEMARQHIRDDPSTAEIAKALGVDLEDYVEQVLDYARHPEKEPQLDILDDDAIAELGPDAPSLKDVTEWFDKVASGEIKLDGRVEIAATDGYSASADAAESLRAKAGADAPLRAPKVDELNRGRSGADADGGGSVLKQQLLQQQRNFQLGMDARRAGQPTRTPPKPPKRS